MTPAAAQTNAKPRRPEGPFAAKMNFAERLPTLQLTLERAAELCTASLQELAPDLPLVTLKGIENGIAEDVVAGAGSAIVAGLLHASKWDAHLIVTLRQDAILALVELLLGGDGSEPADLGTRPLSKIETRLARSFFVRLARALEEAFAPVRQTPFSAETGEEELDLEAVGSVNAPMAVAKYHIEFCGRGGEIQVAIPMSAIGEMRTVLAVVPKKEKARPVDTSWMQRIEQEITRSRVVLNAILDERPMMLGEIVNLRVGQVLPLAATPESRVRVECNGERLMWCQLGKSNDAYTLRVDQYVDQEREFMDDILAG
jgi:flagellar motor switch protein FliM